MSTELEIQNEIRILDHDAGDIPIRWNPNNADEVEIARAAFDKAKAKGFAMYKMSRDGEKLGSPLRDFDPSVERIIGIPKVQGGCE